MRRREFMMLVSGAATSPLLAYAQQRERMRRIGVLMPLSVENAAERGTSRCICAGIGSAGLDRRAQPGNRCALGCGRCRSRSQSRDRIGGRSAGHNFDFIQSAVGTVATASRTVPIVFVLTIDPVGAGDGARLTRPAAMPPAFCCLNTASAESGWNC